MDLTVNDAKSHPGAYIRNSTSLPSPDSTKLLSPLNLKKLLEYPLVEVVSDPIPAWNRHRVQKSEIGRLTGNRDLDFGSLPGAS